MHIFLVNRLIDESVRWLLMNGRTEEAERILKKAARWNGKKFTNIEDLYKEAHRLQNTENGKDDICMVETTDHETKTVAGSEDVSKSHATSEKYTIVDILKNPELRIDTFILWYAW